MRATTTLAVAVLVIVHEAVWARRALQWVGMYNTYLVLYCIERRACTLHQARAGRGEEEEKNGRNFG